MPLYDVTHKDTLVKPTDAQNYDLLLKAKLLLGTLRFNKDLSIFDDAIDHVVGTATAKNKLIFTKAGFVMGYDSPLPHKDVLHVWESAEIAFQSLLPNHRTDPHAEEHQLKFVGGLLRWRISLQPDIWLVYRRPSGNFNRFTGKEITVSEYWVNNDYQRPPKVKGFSVNELKNRFHSEHHYER